MKDLPECSRRLPSQVHGLHHLAQCLPEQKTMSSVIDAERARPEGCGGQWWRDLFHWWGRETAWRRWLGVGGTGVGGWGLQQGEIRLRERVSLGERVMCTKGRGRPGDLWEYWHLEEEACGGSDPIL